MARHNFQMFGMGARTLRSDTAVVAMVAMVNERMRGEATHGSHF